MFNFKSLHQLLNYFSDEKICWDYLEKQLWDGKPVCPHCGSTKVYRLEKNYKQFKCGNKKTCDKKFTVLVGTMYESTKLPLSKWFGAVHLITNHKKGISSCQLAKDLDITQRSAWFMLHRINEMVRTAAEQTEVSEQISIDETYVKGKAANRSKSKRKLIREGWIKDEPAIVLGILQNNKDVVLKVVKNAEASELKEAIAPHVPNASETLLVTDGHTSYPVIARDYKAHIVVNHAVGEYVKDGFHTNNIEGAFSWFKRTIYGTHHNVSPKHIQRYCNAFSYRYNTRRFNDALRFDTIIHKAEGRLKYKDLVK